jgi:hypothetical protein
MHGRQECPIDSCSPALITVLLPRLVQISVGQPFLGMIVDKDPAPHQRMMHPVCIKAAGGLRVECEGVSIGAIASLESTQVGLD